MTEESKENQEPSHKEGEFDEHTSYSFLFFLTSGALLFVTLWAFWDDEYARRGYKGIQEVYFQEQYARTQAEFNDISDKIREKEAELIAGIAVEEDKLDDNDEYQVLADAALDAQIHLDEVTEEKKFAKSHLDEYYYYYKKALHEGKNYDVQLAMVHDTEVEIEAFNPILGQLAQERDEAENKLIEFKARKETFEKDLLKLVNEKIILQGRMDYYKPYPFIWRPAEILQTVIPAYGKNSFAEITYKVDRCQTCHIAYDDSHYENFENPMKSHPVPEIYIDKHDPTVTGCTWCHQGQGTVTYPVEDAHGSHHEMDQTKGINELLLRGDMMQSNCRNCHAPVMNLKGAPVLSKAKKMFVKLGCHGCHLADGYKDERKVGPDLTRISAKVDPSWVYRWVKKPRDYLPKTNMPDFGLSDEHAQAITAYILDASEEGYQLPEKFTGGNTQKGKKLFESVGCQACHKLNGNGEFFAPDLSRIVNKVNADWLVSWISNPHDYSPRSIMPDLRLSVDEASDITAYLMQFGKREPIPGLERKLKDPATIELGKKLVRRRACYACHEINGMEKGGRIGPELSAFGSKQIRELEFGDSHIPHTWESWARNKLKDPNTYRTERILDKMPNFHFDDEEVETLLVLLKGFNGVKIPENYRKKYSEKEMALEKGMKLIEKFNCKGCHVVEGFGGDIQSHLSSKKQYPPPLEMGSYHVGERLKGSWLFSFMKKPTPVRTWMKVKMPTFALTDQEVRDLTAYFEAKASMEIKYEGGIHVKKNMENINDGVRMVNYMDCGKCHDDGAKGIDFSIAAQRLRQSWISKWLKDTREMIPWTGMPSHWPKKGGKYTIATKFSELEFVKDGNIDLQVDAIRDFIVSYNSEEIDFDLSLESDEDEAEDGGDDEEEDEEDEEE